MSKNRPSYKNGCPRCPVHKRTMKNYTGVTVPAVHIFTVLSHVFITPVPPVHTVPHCLSPNPLLLSPVVPVLLMFIILSIYYLITYININKKGTRGTSGTTPYKSPEEKTENHKKHSHEVPLIAESLSRCPRLSPCPQP